jgi:hypothetical protein
LYSSKDSSSSYSSSRLNISGSQYRIHSLPQYSFPEYVSFLTAPNAYTPCHSSPSYQLNKIPKPNQKISTQSFIILLNCAKSIQTISYILQVATKSPNPDFVGLQEPRLESNGLSPVNDAFIIFYSSYKPKCAMYIRSLKYICTSQTFAKSNCFLRYKILYHSLLLFIL